MKLTQRIQKGINIEKVVVFGSYARGQEKKGRDNLYLKP